MDKNISSFDTSKDLIRELGENIVKLIQAKGSKNQRFSWLVSGGRTPELLFRYLNDRWLTKINWKLVDVFWVDERCVSVKSNDSNYGQAYRLLFKNCNGVTLHPMFTGRGSIDESLSYQNTVREYIRINGAFDFALLGIGEDGHFASLFHKNDFLNTKHVFFNKVDRHAYMRMTMNITLILNSKSINVIALGGNKGNAFKENKGILDTLPLGTRFWVDNDFIKVLTD